MLRLYPSRLALLAILLVPACLARPRSPAPLASGGEPRLRGLEDDLAAAVEAERRGGRHFSQRAVWDMSEEERRGLAWGKTVEYSGYDFFDSWDFYTGADPSHGLVKYVLGALWRRVLMRSYTDSATAYKDGLAFYTDAGVPGIQVDHWSAINEGDARNSVRVSSKDIFSGGLFIIDLMVMPFGCGVWPAFWTLGYQGDWPSSGEIDIVENIMDATNNRMTIHTTPGCYIDTTPGLYTGTTGGTDCDSSTGTDHLAAPRGQADVTGGSGCGIVSDSATSFGQPFNQNGGGVFSMLWNGSGIYMWNWNRAEIPADITAQTPCPNSWGTPVALFSASACDIGKYFQAQVLILNIDLCGDWAGNDYSQYSYCPGTCAQQIVDPSNLADAVMIINSIRVYQLGTSSVVSAQADHASNLTGAGGSVGRSGAMSKLAPAGWASILGVLAGVAWVLRGMA